MFCGKADGHVSFPGHSEMHIFMTVPLFPKREARQSEGESSWNHELPAAPACRGEAR